MEQLKKWIPFPFLCAALVLMILPLGYLMVFASGPGEEHIKAFSWFDGTSWGYGHFFPLPSAVLATVSFVLFLVSRFTGRCGGICLGTLIVSAVLSILTLFTAGSWNGWGVVTAVLLALAAIMQALVHRWETQTSSKKSENK